MVLDCCKTLTNQQRESDGFCSQTRPTLRLDSAAIICTVGMILYAHTAKKSLTHFEFSFGFFVVMSCAGVNWLVWLLVSEVEGIIRGFNDKHNGKAAELDKLKVIFFYQLVQLVTLGKE